MLCEPHALPSASYKIVRKHDACLLVFCEGTYQIIMLCPCNVIAKADDLTDLEMLWCVVTSFVDKLSSEILESPPHLLEAVTNRFYGKNIIPSENPNAIPVVRKVDSPRRLNRTVSDKKVNEFLDFNSVIEHIYSQPSLDGIASVVSSIQTPSLIERLVNERNNNMETVLHMACVKDNVECAKVFVELGCDVNAKDKNGWTALHCACYEGFTDLCEFLLRNGSFVMPLSHSRTIPLHYLVRSVTEITWPDHSRILDIMLLEGVDINAKDIHGKTPLHHILYRGRNQQCVEYLVEHKADVNCKIDGDEMTPIHIASIHGNIGLLKCLLEAKGDPNVSCKVGTALELAIHNNNPGTERLLRSYMDKDHGGKKRGRAITLLSSESLQKYENSEIIQLNGKIERMPSVPLVLPSNITKKTDESSNQLARSTSSLIKPPKSMDGFDSDPLETYPCKFDGMYGFLYIWQRYLVFETQKEERFVIQFKEKH